MALPTIAGTIPAIGEKSQPQQHSRLSYRWLASSPLHVAPVFDLFVRGSAANQNRASLMLSLASSP
jgi:hypothetical protein